MSLLTSLLVIIAAPGSMALGGGVAYVRCRLRGEVQTFDRAEVLDELNRQG